MLQNLVVEEPFLARQGKNIQLSGIAPVSTKTLGGVAAQRLRDALRRGDLPSGVHLVERDLATQLGISRIPVREAIQMLVEEGLLKRVPHAGVFVQLPTLNEIEEISSLRVELERFIVKRLMARWQPEHVVRLQRLIDQMKQPAKDKDLYELYELDYKFHNEMWEMADHRILLEMVSNLRERINRFLYETAMATPSFKFSQYITAHQDLLKAIKSGNVRTAQSEIARHVTASQKRIVAHYKLVAERPEAE